MCRNIKQLFNFNPPATKEEIHEASLQYVRKLSGVTKPSRLNEGAFQEAVEKITSATQKLLDSMVTNSTPRDRETEAKKARLRNEKRFGAQ